MKDVSIEPVIPLGLWELDAGGRVLNYEFETAGLVLQFSEIIGKHFFNEILHENHFKTLRDQVERFALQSASAHSFDLMLDLGDGETRTKVLLGRIHDSTSGGARILIHVRKAA